MTINQDNIRLQVTISKSLKESIEESSKKEEIPLRLWIIQAIKSKLKTKTK